MYQIFQSQEIDNIVELNTLNNECIFDNADISGIWINVVSPTSAEIELLSDRFNIEQIAFSYSLDENEGARIDQEDDYVLIIINYPVYELNKYITRPIGIIITNGVIITISHDNTDFLKPFLAGRIKTLHTRKKGRFFFQLFYRVTTLYILYLTHMGKRLDTVEEQLKNSTKNAELLKLLSLNNSLVYFSTSLRGNQTVLEKISRSDNEPFRIYEEDRDLLDDILIENRQSIDMTKTYINILSSTMDAYANIINNNLNTVMKFMTACTIVIMVPTFIVSLYGMNVQLPLQDHPLGFVFIIGLCCILTTILILFFTRRRFF